MGRTLASIFRLVTCFGVISLLGTSCSKEPLEGPHCTNTIGVAKDGSEEQSDPDMNGGTGTGNVGDDGGSSISDDGDDLGDRERNRKKKPH